jgi:NAD(P)-dependent dehydrogenase (short-subunit alcohol dehydrogenase family)
MGGRVAFPGGAFYHAAKYGLLGWPHESTAQEVAEFNIKVQIIEPGSIKTNFQANVRWTEELTPTKNGTVGQLRRWIAEHGEESNAGDQNG